MTSMHAATRVDGSRTSASQLTTTALSCGYFTPWVIKLDSFVKASSGANEIGSIVESSAIVGTNLDDCLRAALCFVRPIRTAVGRCSLVIEGKCACISARKVCVSKSSFAHDDRVGSRGASEPKRHVLWFLGSTPQRAKTAVGSPTTQMTHAKSL